MKSARITDVIVRPVRGGRLFARCKVFDRRADFEQYLHGVGYHRSVKRTRGLCIGIEVKRGQRTRNTGEFATVCFWKGEMGGGLVAHELLHATFCWARRKRMDFTAIGAQAVETIPRDHPEESITTAHGQMVASFVDQCYQRGLYGKAAA